MSETFDQTKIRLETFIKETFPQADVAPGSVISELVVKLAATVQNDLNNAIDTLSQQNSISDVLSSTTSTTSAVIDEIASNYNTTRIAGSKSVGQLKITVATKRNYIVAQGTQFLQPSLNLVYTVTADFKVAQSPANGEAQLYINGGIYYFLMPVEAVSVGSSSQIQSGTPFQLNTGSNLTDFVSAEAYGNFTSGTDGEDDQALVQRFQQGLSNKGLLSPASITASLKAQFSGIQAISVAGAGDPELLRSKRNIMGISTFGMADVYVRSSFGLQTSTLTKTATKLADGKWTLTMDRLDVPGFYQINSIRPLDTSLIGSLLITSQTFGIDVPATQRVNQITEVSDARFTMYQTCVVNFDYNETPGITIGDTQDVEVIVSYQPFVSDIQDVFLNDDTRIACADYLVKAVLPCFVSLDIKLVKVKSTDTVAVEDIKQAIFNYINSIPFGESLYASKIIDICHNFNIKQVDLPISMSGNVLANDGTSVLINSSDLLTIPTDIDLGISDRTTMFFVDYQTNGVDNIGIQIT